MSLFRRRYRYLASVFLVLALSIPALRGMIWYRYWGLDFQNLHAFHNGCGGAADPYTVSGITCGDPLGRDLIYPPLLYWAFAWTRWVPFQYAYRIWDALILGGLALALRVFARPRRSELTAWALVILMLPQLPTVFALERGNNDVLIVVLWTLALVAYQRGWLQRMGALVALAVQAKLYPLFAALALAPGLIRRSPRWLTGVIIATAAAWLALLPSSNTYFSRVLPGLAAWRNKPSYLNHSVITFFPGREWIGYALAAIPIACWAWLGHLRLRKDPALLFAGSLACSTYFSGVSENYNLITAFPLLFLLMARALREARGRWFYQAFSVAGFIAILGNKIELGRSSVFLQLVWLAALPSALAWLRSREPSEAWARNLRSPRST